MPARSCLLALCLAALAACDDGAPTDGDADADGDADLPATCETASTVSYELCGDASETVEQWIAACEADQASYASDCAAEFQAMLDCQATTAETSCSIRCRAEVEALAGCGDPCTACVVDRCADEVAACEANAECVAIIACIAACPDDACVTACVQSHPDGAAEIQAQALCQRNECADACD